MPRQTAGAGTHFRRLGGPPSWSGQVLEKTNLLPTLAFDPQNIQPIASHYTDHAIPDQILTLNSRVNNEVADHFWYSCLLGLLASVMDGSWPCVISLICQCIFR